jgi:hypothetical protein
MLCNHTYGKLQNVLINELNKNISEYDVYGLKNLDFQKKVNVTLCGAEFYIKKHIYSNNSSRVRHEPKLCIHNKSAIKMLKFIWVLNGNAEYYFWDKYMVKAEIGTFLLFPVSWCYPYNEVVMLDKYTISGFIYL